MSSFFSRVPFEIYRRLSCLCIGERIASLKLKGNANLYDWLILQMGE
jgi:hypothetical protein